MKWYWWALLLGGGIFLLVRKAAAKSPTNISPSSPGTPYPMSPSIDVRMDFIEADIRGTYGDDITAMSRSYDPSTGKATFSYTYKANGEVKSNRERYSVHPDLPDVHPMIKGLM
jgi:hypothetical protein